MLVGVAMMMADIADVVAAAAQIYQESLAVDPLQNVLLEEEVVASTSSMMMILEKKIHYCRCLCLVSNSCLQWMFVFDLQTRQPHYFYYHDHSS